VNPGEVVTAMAERLLGKVEPAKGVTFTGDLAQLAGTWRGTGRGSPLSVQTAVDSGVLTMRAQGPKAVPLRFVGNDTFEAGSNRIIFIREGGRATKIRFDGVAVVSILDRVP
jgi:hypothetical protein